MDVFKEKKEQIIIVFIFLLALGLRLGYLVFLKGHYFFYDHPSSDVLYYQEWGHEIATGNWLGKKVFFGLPLYPYFLAVLERLTLGNLFSMRLLHLLMGSFNCILTYYIAKKIFSDKVACIAAILMASNFILIYYDWLMMPVTLIILFSLFIVISFLHIESITQQRDWFILGLLMGIVTLGDGKFLIYFALACFYIAFRWQKPLLYKITTIILPLTFGLSLILFSVTLRNKLVGGDWVFISAQSGLSLYTGNNPDATGIYEHPFFLRPSHVGQDEDQKIMAETILQKKLTPREVSQFWRTKALNFIQQEPSAYFILLLRKFQALLRDNEEAHDADLILQREWRQRLDLNSYFIICPLAIVGMVLAWRKRKDTAYVNLLILSQLIITMVFFLTTRHRATILPFLIIYESYCLCWIIEQIRTHQFKQLSITALLLVIYLVVFRPKSVAPETIQFIHYAKSGPIYESQKQYKEAQQQYLNAIKLRPYDTTTLSNLGNAYLLDENFKKAEQYYLRALETCHYNVDALFNLGYTYEQTGSPDLALQFYRKVLVYQPESLDTHYRIAGVYQKQGDCQSAKKYYSFITSERPLMTDKINELISRCE